MLIYGGHIGCQMTPGRKIPSHLKSWTECKDSHSHGERHALG